MTKTAIRLDKITFHYPNSDKGLVALSLQIPAQQKTVVLGLNGAGKSTLFLLLCGILKPKSGQYFLNDKPFVFSKKERTQIGNHIGYVFQDPEIQLFAPTVFDDVAFGLRNNGWKPDAVKQKVNEHLDFLNITHLKDNAPHELSYGQKKLVAIAGVLVMQPKILILDEPFAWLDNVQKQNMKAILDRLHEQGMTIILSTHNLDFAYSWADYGVVLQEGKCTQIGKIDTLTRNHLT